MPLAPLVDPWNDSTNVVEGSPATSAVVSSRATLAVREDAEVKLTYLLRTFLTSEFYNIPFTFQMASVSSENAPESDEQELPSEVGG